MRTAEEIINEVEMRDEYFDVPILRDEIFNMVKEIIYESKIDAIEACIMLTPAKSKEEHEIKTSAYRYLINELK